jgi:hypothetical protein
MAPSLYIIWYLYIHYSRYITTAYSANCHQKHTSLHLNILFDFSKRVNSTAKHNDATVSRSSQTGLSMKVVLLVALLCVLNVCMLLSPAYGINFIFCLCREFVHNKASKVGPCTSERNMVAQIFYLQTKTCYFSLERRLIIIRCCGRNSCRNVSKISSQNKQISKVG